MVQTKEKRLPRILRMLAKTTVKKITLIGSEQTLVGSEQTLVGSE